MHNHQFLGLILINYITSIPCMVMAAFAQLYRPIIVGNAARRASAFGRQLSVALHAHPIGGGLKRRLLTVHVTVEHQILSLPPVLQDRIDGILDFAAGWVVLRF
jgi:hypothetical protein